MTERGVEMLKLVYWAIVVFFGTLTVVVLYREKKLLAQITCALVLVVLLLRVLGLK